MTKEGTIESDKLNTIDNILNALFIYIHYKKNVNNDIFFTLVYDDSFVILI